MISVKKTGTKTWKYSWHIGKAIRGEVVPMFPNKIDAIEWSISDRIKENDQVCSIVIQGYKDNWLVFRMTGKAIHLADYVQIIISSRIDY